MDLKGKTVVVVGLGKSGVSAVRLCAGRGATVIGNDARTIDQLNNEVRALGIELVLGGHAGAPFAKSDLIVVSPGVPRLAELDDAAARGVEVIGELELATRFLDAPLLCVGGTNGKSTTTTLLGDLLRAAGLRTFVGGNLGTPATEAVSLDWDAAVLEVSSFQLERAPTFRPKVSVLLNITEDHLDRYASFDEYASAKGNAFVNQTGSDVAVIPHGDQRCEGQARRGGAVVQRFGVHAASEYVIAGRAVIERGTRHRFDLADVPLHGRHNLENAAAAIAAARGFGIETDAIERGLAQFRPLPHRMSHAGTIRDVHFYDDSKGTNVGASVTALLGLAEEKGVLIAGGRDKHGSYEPLVTALERKGRAVVLIGEAADRIAAAVGGRLPVTRAASMTAAVRTAFELAARGDAVLLSPACSSFDMFSSYADRGDQFVAAVRALELELQGGKP